MKALVIGAGISGLGCARLLNHESYQVSLVTNHDFLARSEMEALGIKVYLDDKDLSLVKDYDLVVKSPGIPNEHPLVSQFDPVIDEIEVAWRFSKDTNYYAISGTNGKTTTVNLLHAMLKTRDDKALLAGNVGVSLSESILNYPQTKNVALEISAFQMEQTPSFSPKVYGLLNLSPDHLDRFENEEAYYKAKLLILDRVGIFVRNCDDALIVEKTKNFKGKSLNLSLEKRKDMDVYLKDQAIYYNEIKLFDLKDLKVPGKHNLMNAAFASITAYLAGVSLEGIKQALNAFRGVEHRCEFVRDLNGVAYYNDSKATNPESCLVALDSFDPKHTVLLAGGYDKKIAFDILRPYADQLKAIFLFGDSKDQMKEVFTNAILVSDLEEAVMKSQDLLESGDICLLSPACASYDQFKNFEERGQIFKEMVNRLI